MIPLEAYTHLKEMNRLAENEFGDFWIVRCPLRRKRDVDLFVSCIKCLGAHSTGPVQGPGTVAVTCGDMPDELRFRLKERK